MNSKISLFAGTVGALMGLIYSAGATTGYLSDDFSGRTEGQSPDPSLGWGVASGVIVTNHLPHSSANALFVPVLSGATNNFGISTNNGQVWTDFYTKPIRLSTSSPAVDTNATAQVFVNSNGIWCTLSGAGDGETVYTNTWASILTGVGTYPTVEVASTWRHVSVLHDYAASRRKWSLFVDDKLLATNLGFIANVQSGSLTNYSWFQVQNLGGDPSNVVWVDDFVVTNKIPSTASGTLGATNAIGTTNGIPPAYALNYFGISGDPRPVSTNFGLATNIGPTAVSLQFHAQPYQQYVLIGGQSPLGAMSTISTVLVDAAGTSNFVADAGALSGSRSNYFYKILTVSTVDGTVVFTNSETYAWYRQDRPVMNRWYYSGIPVSYEVSSNNTLASLAGQQLAQGLSGSDNDAVADRLMVGSDTFYLTLSGNWEDVNAGTVSPGTITLKPGTGVSIYRKAGSSSLNKAIVSGLWTNSITAISLRHGWNKLIWPYDTVATSNNCKFPNTNGDKYIVQRGANGGTVLGAYNGSVWLKANGTSLQATDWPQAGDGFMYYNTAADGAKSWSPVR